MSANLPNRASSRLKSAKEMKKQNIVINIKTVGWFYGAGSNIKKYLYCHVHAHRIGSTCTSQFARKHTQPTHLHWFTHFQRTFVSPKDFYEAILCHTFRVIPVQSFRDSVWIFSGFNPAGLRRVLFACVGLFDLIVWLLAASWIHSALPFCLNCFFFY